MIMGVIWEFLLSVLLRDGDSGIGSDERHNFDGDVQLNSELYVLPKTWNLK